MSCQTICVSLHTGMMLKGNTTLKVLDLDECGLQPEGLEEVMKGVEVNTKLEALYLKRNIIDNKRASCLGKNDINVCYVHMKERITSYCYFSVMLFY